LEEDVSYSHYIPLEMHREERMCVRARDVYKAVYPHILRNSIRHTIAAPVSFAMQVTAFSPMVRTT